MKNSIQMSPARSMRWQNMNGPQILEGLLYREAGVGASGQKTQEQRV